MEPIVLFSFLALFFSGLYFLFILSSTSQQKSNVDPSKYPPGKTGWPIVGETLHLIYAGAGTFMQERMNKYSKHIFKTSLLLQPVAFFCGQDGNKFLFSMDNKTADSWYPPTIQKMFPHVRRKEEFKDAVKMSSPFLKLEARDRCLSIINKVVEQHLVTKWDDKKKVTVWPLAMNYSLSLVCNLFMSYDDPAGVEELSELYIKMGDGLVSVPIDLPGTPYSRGVKAAKLVMNKIIAIVKQRRNDEKEKKVLPTQDMLSHLLVKVDADGNLMDDTEIAAVLSGLLMAGHITSATVMSFFVKYLAELPGVYSEVLKEVTEIESSKNPGEPLNSDDIQKMKYSWNVAREVMRILPRSLGGFREAIADFNYKGYTVPKGWKLIWSPDSSHKNPDYFPEPEKFDPTRFEGKGPAPFTYIPFGGGQFMCPGVEFAKLQTLVFIYHVVRKYKWVNVVADEKITLHPFPKPANGLPILIQPRIA